MKKTYIVPVTEEIVLKNQYSLLTGSLIDPVTGNAEIVDTGDIVDTEGTLDPDARKFDLEYEEYEEF